MADGTEPPQRRCANCGAGVRVDTNYCASCKGAMRGALYAQRVIATRDFREAARRVPLVPLAVVAGALVLVWVLAGSGMSILTSVLLVLGIATISWALLRNHRKGRNLGSRPGPRLDQVRPKGPTGWELGEIERELERLHARKRRDRVWYALTGLIFLVFFGVMTSMVGEYAIVFVLPALLFVVFIVFASGDPAGERIAYLERRKAYLEQASREWSEAREAQQEEMQRREQERQEKLRRYEDQKAERRRREQQRSEEIRQREERKRLEQDERGMREVERFWRDIKTKSEEAEEERARQEEEYQQRLAAEGEETRQMLVGGHWIDVTLLRGDWKGIEEENEGKGRWETHEGKLRWVTMED